jgi:hypothetical protein
MKKISSLCTAACMLAAAANANGEAGDVHVGLQGGTLGIGLEAGVDLSDYFALRGGVNYIKFDFDTTIDAIDYTFEPEFFNGSLFLDWHPFAGSFRMTAGAFINNNSVDVHGTYRKDLIPEPYNDFRDLVDLVPIKGSVDFNTFAPYAGIGWTSNKADQGWGVNIDLGVMFQGSPNVSDLYIDDPWGIGNNGLVKDFLDQERKAIEDELDRYRYYPVASIAVTYKF